MRASPHSERERGIPYDVAGFVKGTPRERGSCARKEEEGDSKKREERRLASGRRKEISAKQGKDRILVVPDYKRRMGRTTTTFQKITRKGTKN